MDNNVTKPAVVLFSYMRPELTSAAILRLVHSPHVGKVFVSIDGIRPGAAEQEIAWRAQTLKVSESLNEQYKNIEVLNWSVNSGLTDHAIRAFSTAFEFSNGVLSIEEDLDISGEGLEFLARHSGANGDLSAASSFSRYHHFNHGTPYRRTFFPEQWGTSLNVKLFEEFLRIRTGRVVSESVVKQAVDQTPGIGKSSRKAISAFWTELFSGASTQASHGDALMAYSAMSLGLRFKVPWTPFTVDLGGLDSRGLHTRKPIRDIVHKLPSEPIEQESCARCDRANSRLNMGLSWQINMLRKKIRRHTL